METIRVKIDDYDLENLINFLQNINFITENLNYNTLINGIKRQVLIKLETKLIKGTKAKSLILQKYEAVALTCLYMDGKFQQKGDLADLNLKILMNTLIKYLK